ncbi:MAG: tetratricopeptide repeat protein [Ardenticatenaceae bacterium]|nr:tetratricopeptide repeat protein [Ardenticatenaceae bacterium]
MTQQTSDNPTSTRRPTPKELRLSLFLPIAITLAVWVVGAIILVIVPLQFNLILGLLVGLSLVIYLVYWTRKARRALQVTAVLFAIPALAGITWGMIQGSLTYTFAGLAVTFVLLLGQRLLNTPFSYRAAYRHFVNGRNDLALDLISRSIAARPDFWESYQLRALLHLMNLNFYHAEQDARAALARKPNAHPVYNTLGQIYLAQNRFADAVDAYTAALELAPDYALYNFHLGLSQYRLGQYRAAADALAAATQGTMPLLEHDLQASYYLGRSLEALGETAVAQEAFTLMTKFREGLAPLRRNLEQQPDYPHVALQLADIADMKARLAQQEDEESNE